MIMRICQNCRAELNDFDSVCEYCGYEFPVNVEFESAMDKATQILNSLQRMTDASYKIVKADLRIYEEALSFTDNIKVLYSESRKAQDLIHIIEKTILSLQDKIQKFKKSQYTKTKIFSLFLYFLCEIGIFFLIVIVSVSDADTVKSFAVGLPAFLCALVGAGLSSDSGYIWGGFLGGMIVGGLIGYLIFLLIGTSLGQLIFIILGTIGLIVGTVCRIKGAKKKWL